MSAEPAFFYILCRDGDRMDMGRYRCLEHGGLFWSRWEIFAIVDVAFYKLWDFGLLWGG